MNMASVGRPTRPETPGPAAEILPATLSGGKGLFQSERLIFDYDDHHKTGVDLPDLPADYAEDDLQGLVNIAEGLTDFSES